MTTILVTGASGNLGSALLPRLSAPSDVRLGAPSDVRLGAPSDARLPSPPDARPPSPSEARPGARSFDVRPMSRRVRPGWVAADLSSGTGVSEAVRGADVVVHLASSPTKTRSTDVEGTRRLAAAAAEAGVRHFIYMSIEDVADRIVTLVAAPPAGVAAPAP